MFHGDVNLSCTMTFLSTLGSFAFTSLWVYLLGRQVLVRSSNRVSNTLFTFVNDSLALWRLDWSNIPHICHFFYTGKIFGEKIYTEKRVNYDKLHSKLPILRVNYDKLHSKLPIFPVKSLTIYTGQLLFYTDMSVVSVTNMRYVITIS
jgi:hypothetical protein